MARKHHHQNNRPKSRGGAARDPNFRAAIVIPEKKIPIEYGKAFVLLEDVEKNAFIYKGGQWVRHTASIAECRQDCQVKELPQKINGMTRYEVRAPLV